MRTSRLRYFVILVAALALVLPVTSVADAQQKGTIKIATQSPLSGELAALGVYVGTYCQPMIPSLYQPVADPMETIRTIKAIGPERCIIGSDFGQVLHVNSVDGVRIFIRALLAFGISPEEIRVMIRDNPAKLMWLDD